MGVQTDHQSLSFTISDKNSNVEMERWCSLTESFNPKIIYNPEQKML